VLERMLELWDKVDIARHGGIASSAEVCVGDADRLGLGGGDIASGGHGCGCEKVRGGKNGAVFGVLSKQELELGKFWSAGSSQVVTRTSGFLRLSFHP